MAVRGANPKEGLCCGGVPLVTGILLIIALVIIMPITESWPAIVFLLLLMICPAHCFRDAVRSLGEMDVSFDSLKLPIETPSHDVKPVIKSVQESDPEN